MATSERVTGSAILFLSTPGFQPFVTGEEICASLGPVVNHIDAIIPRGRDTWEVHITDTDVATGLELTGVRIRGRSLEMTQRHPGGTWVRVRGFPLDTSNIMVETIFKNFGQVVSGPHHATWRGTNIKTGDRTLKMKLNRNIPQAFTTMDSKVRVTVRYRDQPQTCFLCGDTGHEKKDCTKESYATKVKRPTPIEPTDPDKSFSSPEEVETSDPDKKKKDKKERKKKERKEKETAKVSIPEGKRKDVSSPEAQPPTVGFHFMPSSIPLYKARKT